jgi:hypothetical protein
MKKTTNETQRYVALKQHKGSTLVGVDLFVRGKKVLISKTKSGSYGFKYCLEGENVFYGSIAKLIAQAN